MLAMVAMKMMRTVQQISAGGKLARNMVFGVARRDISEGKLKKALQWVRAMFIHRLRAGVERRRPQRLEWLGPPPGHQTPAHPHQVAFCRARSLHQSGR